MIKHIVLFELANHVKDNDAQLIIDKLNALKKTTIPQIKSLSGGKSCSIENLEKGFNFGFIMEFENEKDRDFYVHHPDHKKVIEENILPVLKNGIHSCLVFDYKV